MSKGVNKVILIGNLGADPEIRYMPNGSAVANISVATNESWKDKQTGELQERTEWHRVSLFDKLAQIVAEYLKKGSKVYIEGSLRTRKWQDQSGSDRYITEIIASSMQMLDSKDTRVKGNNFSEQGSSEEPMNMNHNMSNNVMNAGHTMQLQEQDEIPF